MDLGLTDKTYIVTGGTRGLGRATAEALVADGANVVVASRSTESVDAAVATGAARAACRRRDDGVPRGPAVE